MQNHYRVLGLPFNASPRRIKEQYRKLAKTYHPDRQRDPATRAEAEERFKEITQAYKALSKIVDRARLTPRQRKLDFLYEQGRRRCEQNQWSRAIVIFTEILAIDAAYRDTVAHLREARRKQRHIATLYKEADQSFRQKKWSEAAAGFESVLREAPHYRDAAPKFKKARREQRKEAFMRHY